MRVLDGERRADLCKHHFLRMKLDFRGGFATTVSLAYLGASVPRSAMSARSTSAGTINKDIDLLSLVLSEFTINSGAVEVGASDVVFE